MKLTIILLALGQSCHAHPGRNVKNQPCPFLEQSRKYHRLSQVGQRAATRDLADRVGDGGIPDGGFAAVQEDLIDLMTDSKPEWPADFGSYAGLMIRLAWHCSGSYRDSDGRGGCDGGRIRFAPEADWEDNENLDKALMLLEPIKEKYGSKLSWGDLIILAGNAAIKSTGGPILGFCGGRIDDADGSDSIRLGPSQEQEAIAPCLSLDINGDCLSVVNTALGPTTMGLIYVNPGGPVTNPNNPVASGNDIRRAFGRMGFDDQTSVILIGAGHALGKAHGACMDPPCGDGKGNNTWTSGFEGAWTLTPTQWSNMFFNNLFDFDWELVESSGGGRQWTPFVKATGEPGPGIFMLTTDLALRDDELYRPYSEMYAMNRTLHDQDFASAWYRLTSSDMGPHVRCIGDLVPDPQPWQYNLPPSPSNLPSYIAARAAIQGHLDENPEEATNFISLAYRCASTFRATDYRGGCNGARIRFEPESDWESNAGSSELVAKLESLKDSGGFVDVSTADMIVLAGITALEHENPALEMPFCGGYVDAENAGGSEVLAPRIYDDAYVTVTDDFLVKGLTFEQGVALASREHGVSSEWYKSLLNPAVNVAGAFTELELALKEGDLNQFVELFASDSDRLHQAFISGWSYMMTADRFKSNRESVCSGVSIPTKDDTVVDPPTPTEDIDGTTPPPPTGGDTTITPGSSAASFGGVLLGVMTTITFTTLITF